MLSLPVQQHASSHAACKFWPQPASGWIHVRQTHRKKSHKTFSNHVCVYVSRCWAWRSLDRCLCRNGQMFYKIPTGTFAPPDYPSRQTYVFFPKWVRLTFDWDHYFTLICLILQSPRNSCSLLFYAVWRSISASRRKPSLTSKSHWTPSWFSAKSRGPLWWLSRRLGTAPLSTLSWARE